MLIMHEILRIKKLINKYPEALDRHLQDIQNIKNEFRRGLPSKRFIEDLNNYAYDIHIKNTKKAI